MSESSDQARDGPLATRAVNYLQLVLRCPRQVPRRTRRAAALALLAAVPGVSGCRDARRVTPLPPDPPGVTRPAEYAFGDDTRHRDWRAQRQVLDQIETRVGARTVRLESMAAPNDLDPQAVARHYERALVAGQGWRSLALVPPWPPNSAWVVAFASADGRAVLAVVGLSPRPTAGGLVPLTLLTNLGPSEPAR